MSNAPANLDVAAIVMPSERYVDGLFGPKELYMQPTELVRQGRIDFNSQRGVLRASAEMANPIDDESDFYDLIKQQIMLLAQRRDASCAMFSPIAYPQTAHRLSNYHWHRVQKAIVSDVASSSVSPCRLKVLGGEGPSRAVETHIEGLLKNLRVPPLWIQEEVEPPTRECKELSLKTMMRLFADHGIIPYKIAASREGGVYAAYRASNNNNILRLDVDNELDAVAVVSDGTTVLCSAFIGNEVEEERLFRMFAGTASPGV